MADRPPTPVADQVAHLMEVLCAVIDVVGVKQVQAQLEQRRADREAEAKKQAEAAAKTKGKSKKR